MNSNFVSTCLEVERASAALRDNVARMDAAVREGEDGLNRLPRVVRGFVSSALARAAARATGQDVPAWAASIKDMLTAVDTARVAARRAETTHVLAAADREMLGRVARQVEAQYGRLGRLIAFMEAAPARIAAVPARFLPPDRRREALDNLAAQTEALRAAMAAMPPLARSLRSLAEEPL